MHEGIVSAALFSRAPTTPGRLKSHRGSQDEKEDEPPSRVRSHCATASTAVVIYGYAPPVSFFSSRSAVHVALAVSAYFVFTALGSAGAAVVFVGGSGAQKYYSNERALTIAREAYEKGKVLGAICIAPGILAKAGVLKGKNATIWDSGSGEFVKILEENGAIYTGMNVEIDGNIITANGPHAAQGFAEAIIEKLVE